MDDSKIIELYFNRSENAIVQTSIKYNTLCLNIATNILGNTEDSEECVNDTYLTLWNNIPPMRPENLCAYICRIIRNLSLKKLEYNQAKKRDKNMVVSLQELEALLPDSLSSHNFSEEETGRIISDFLKTEKPEARNVFIRKYWYFDSVSTIAKRYKFSESKVKSLLFHTRSRLKKHLIKEGVHI